MSESFRPYTEGDTGRTGWSFQCVIAGSGSSKPGRGGLVLTDVRHNGHSFAHEIRVIGLRLDYSQFTTALRSRSGNQIPKSEFLELSPGDFEVSDIIELRNFQVRGSDIPGGQPEPTGASRRALNFRYYPFLFGLEVHYKLKNATFARLFGGNETNVSITGLQLTQTILFSSYQSKPSHEPTGGVMAARIHPLITANFISNSRFDSEADGAITVNSVRYDYYLHKDLEQFDSIANFRRPIDRGQSAAIFKDAEEMMDKAAMQGLSERGLGGAAERSLFLAVEKPLVIEICAKGLEEGYPTVLNPPDRTERIGTWDNVHWWGSGEQLHHVITAPGAFHASHLHWRWGHVVSTSVAVIDGSGPQYRGGLPEELSANFRNRNEYGQQKRGALVDPKCWKQTIEFAIVHFRDNLNPMNADIPMKNLCLEKFSDLFTKQKCLNIPLEEEEETMTGGNLVLWFSMKVHRQPNLTRNGPQMPSLLNGSVFIHGIFFAHDPDPVLSIHSMGLPLGLAAVPSPTLGSDEPLHYPNLPDSIRGQRNWERY